MKLLALIGFIITGSLLIFVLETLILGTVSVHSSRIENPLWAKTIYNIIKIVWGGILLFGIYNILFKDKIDEMIAQSIKKNLPL